MKRGGNFNNNANNCTVSNRNNNNATNSNNNIGFRICSIFQRKPALYARQDDNGKSRSMSCSRKGQIETVRLA